MGEISYHIDSAVPPVHVSSVAYTGKVYHSRRVKGKSSEKTKVTDGE